jgi:ATP-binding cassette subfamily B protein
MSFMAKKQKTKNKESSLLIFLGKFKWQIAIVVIISLVINGLSLILPRMQSPIINSFFLGTYDEQEVILNYTLIIGSIFVLSIIQTIFSSYVSELIAKELRKNITEKISKQSFSYLNTITTSRILTNLTSDVDAVKNFISQGIVVVFSSLVLLIGSSISMLTINAKLAIPVILMIPLLLIIFAFIFRGISKYFVKAQGVIDVLNRVISESIIGASLIRVLNSNKSEAKKFENINTEARNIGVKIVGGFASLIPAVNLISNLIFLIIIGYGGSLVIKSEMTLGDLQSFTSYVGTFILPVILLGFLGNTVARAFASYSRISEITNAKIIISEGTLSKEIKGEIQFKNVNLEYNSKSVLQDISFKVTPGTRTAILGPTAAGKSQLFYLLAGLITPQTGEISIDHININEYDKNSLFKQLGLVFQDSVIFNSTILENINFGDRVDQQVLDKAIETAELKEFIETLPNGLNTMVSERGSSLSGGQKQRITLARALVLNPKILLLDDFTARVDQNTEKRIIANLSKNYPEITLLSITQKISSVLDFDQILLIMEGELIAKGTHEELLRESIEYKQIFESQKSTEE